MPTVPQTQAILQGYFQTGAVPTQDQYAEFIGTMFFLYNETVNNAAAAAASAAATAATVSQTCPTALVQFTVNPSSSANLFTIIGTTFGVASVAWNPGNTAIRITFTNAFANTNYKVSYLQYNNGLPVTSYPFVVATLNTNYVDIFPGAQNKLMNCLLLIWP